MGNKAENEIVFSLRIDKDLYERVKMKAKEEHRSVNQYIIFAIQDYFIPIETKESSEYHRAGAGWSPEDLAEYLENYIDEKIEKKLGKEGNQDLPTAAGDK
jgi:hypothetical protein